MILHQVYRAVALNNLYALERRTSTNTWAQQALDYFNQDHSLTLQWDRLVNGKWAHMTDQTHFGYTYWQQPMRNTLPPVAYVQSLEDSLAGSMGVSCEGSNASVPGDDQYHDLFSETIILPPMDPYLPPPANRWIDIYSKGTTAFDFTITSNTSFIHISTPKGHIDPTTNTSDTRVYLTIDWPSAPPGSSTASLNITSSPGNYGTQYSAPMVIVPINNTAAPPDFHGFVEFDATVAIEAEHATTLTNTSSANLTTVPYFGHTPSGVTIWRPTAPSQTPPDAPELTYDFYASTDPWNGTASVTLYMGDGLNTDPDRPMKYAVAVDGETAQVVQPVASTPLGVLPPSWSGMVSNAGMSNTTGHAVAPGAHTLRLWMLEPGLVVESVVVDLGGVRGSYLGPPESVRV